MDRKRHFILLLCFCCFGALAQPHELVSASGASFHNSSGSISYTIGELVTSTFVTPGRILTQGFLQTGLPKSTRGLPVENLHDIEIIVYPNPVEDLLILELETLQEWEYKLFNVQGILVHQGFVFNGQAEIDFGTLTPSIYILKVFLGSEQSRIFQIVKQ